MATRLKDSASLVKQKKVMNPSDHCRTGTAHTKRASTALKKSTSSSSSTTNVAPTATDKPVRNYLKPTLSSRVESPKPVAKKHISSSPEASAQKPNLTRRNSFDKTQSAAQTLKILTSSGPRERSLAMRSSSFSSQSASLARPVLDRTSKTPKACPVKSQASTIAGNKTTRRSPVSTSSTIRKETSRLTRAQSNPQVVSEILNAESGNLDNEKPEVKDVEEVIVKVEGDHGVEVAPDLQKPENIVDEHDDVILGGDELVKDQETLLDQASVISTVDQDHESTDFAQRELEDTKDKLAERVALETPLVDKIGEDKEQVLSDQTNIIQEEISTEVATADSEDKIEDHAIEKADTITMETGEAEGTSEKPEQAGEEQNQNTPISPNDEEKDEPVEGTVKEEAKPLTIKALTPSKSQRPTQGNSKKDSPAYNDVIAETSSKLMEKRKNKVKALVGAFETVISLEEPQA